MRKAQRKGGNPEIGSSRKTTSDRRDQKMWGSPDGIRHYIRPGWWTPMPRRLWGRSGGKAEKERKGAQVSRFLLPPGLPLAEPCRHEGMGRAACIPPLLLSSTPPKIQQSSEDQRANECQIGWLSAQGRHTLGCAWFFFSHMSLTFTPSNSFPSGNTLPAPFDTRDPSLGTWYIRIRLTCVLQATCPA